LQVALHCLSQSISNRAESICCSRYRQKLAHPVAFLDGGGEGGLELRPEFQLLFRGDQLRGFDQGGELILDHIERRGRNRGRRNYSQGNH
jgi:hypothetical protein